MEIEEIAHRERAHDIEKEIEHLHSRAREAEEAGKHEEAEAIFREAEKLEHHLMEITRPEEKRENKEGLEHEIEILRDEVHQLREHIEKLEEIIHEKVMNR